MDAHRSTDLYFVMISNVCYLCLSAQITFQNQVGKFDLEVTAFQMAVLFAWNQRPDERLSFEDIRYV